jgi:hypothetical protein
MSAWDRAEDAKDIPWWAKSLFVAFWLSVPVLAALLSVASCARRESLYVPAYWPNDPGGAQCLSGEWCEWEAGACDKNPSHQPQAVWSCSPCGSYGHCCAHVEIEAGSDWDLIYRHEVLDGPK